MLNIIKNNLKMIIAFIFGMLISGIVVYGATLNFASKDVEHTKADGTKTTVSAAINDLYSKSITPTKVTGNTYTGTSGYLNGRSSLTASTQLTLANYRSGGQYRFNLGSKEQVTLPAGYYNLPINISNGSSGGGSATAPTLVYHLTGNHATSQTYTFNKNYKYAIVIAESINTDGGEYANISVSNGSAITQVADSPAVDEASSTVRAVSITNIVANRTTVSFSAYWGWSLSIIAME